jgi:OOP family OmpA-OmpF porin
MMKKKLALLVAMSLLTMASAASAANKAETLSFSPVVGGYLFDGKQHLEGNAVYGARIGYNFTNVLGVEALFDYSHNNDSTKGPAAGISMYRYGGELLYHFIPDGTFVPYVAVGYAGVNFDGNSDGVSNKGYKQTHGAFDYGIGAKYFLNDNIAIRGDVRHIIYNYDRTYSNYETTVGLYFAFGGAAPAAKPVAPIADPAPVDSDGDGVYDSLDKCSGTPAGVSVDKDGCPLDSDKDGVADYLDKCPGTAAGVTVDKDGCPPVVEKVVILVSEPKVEEKVQVVVAEPAVVIFALEDVHFDFDQSTLKPEAKIILKRNILLIKENPRAKIRIAGYTSASGSEEYNQKLSERRAASVKAYLVSEGVIESDRLSTVGYGETHPAVYEAAPKDLYSAAAKANIRVLFEVIVQ